MKTLERITVYPIKSLDGIDLNKVEITQGGSLRFDREFALFDEDGKFINGKKFGQIHLIRSIYYLNERLVEFSIEKDNFKKVFHLEKEKTEIESFFSKFLQKKVTFHRNKENGFPDDLSASGPTVVSSASLEEVAKWFPNILVEELYRRFRPNLLISNAPSFWEDNLFGEKGEEKHFQIGDFRFIGMNPCARCAVPTKNPGTGEAISSFQKHFTEMRKSTLPEWSNVSQFDHYYRFCVNTKISRTKAGKFLSVGDVVLLQPQY